MHVDPVERVLLALWERERRGGAAAATAAALRDTLGLAAPPEDPAAHQGSGLDRRTRVEVALSTLIERGAVQARGGDPGGEGGPTRYRLTAEGRDRAAALYAELSSEPVQVRIEDTYRELSVDQLGSHPDLELDVGDREGIAAALEALAPGPDRAVTLDAVEGVRTSAPGTSGPFVDRDRERARLEAAVRSAEGGAGRTVLVGGPGGVGKTRLVAEVLDWASDRDVRTLLGRTRPERTTPYQPVRTALAPALADSDLEDPFEAAADDRARDEDVRDSKRRALFSAVREAVQRAAADRPLVMALEDLHSAGQATVQLLQHLARHRPDGVTIVGTVRTPHLAGTHPLRSDASWPSSATPDRLALETFDRAWTRRLAESVLERRLSEPFLEELYDLTDGNPLFVTETLALLAERGAVDPAAPGPVEAPDEVPVSVKLSEVLEDRIDRLPETPRAVLETAAVAGSPIDPDLLVAASPAPPERVGEAVATLEEAATMRAHAGGLVGFTSGVVRECVREDLDPQRRRTLHRRVAVALDERSPEDPIEWHARLAHHYDRGGEPAAAVEHYCETGERARAVFAHERALDAFERALELAREHGPADRDLDWLLERVGDVLATLDDHEAAESHLAEAAEVASDPARRQHLIARRCRVLLRLDRYEDLLSAAEPALERAPEGSPERYHLLTEAGWAHARRGDLEDAQRNFERALGVARDLDDRRLIGDGLATLGTVTAQLEDFGTATEMFEEAVALARPVADDDPGAKRRLANRLNNLGVGYWKAGERDRARAVAREYMERVREIGDEREIAQGLTNLGTHAMTAGELDLASERFEASIERCRAAGDRRTEAVALRNLAAIRATRGEFDAAIHRAELCLERCGTVEHPRCESAALGVRGRIALMSGNRAAAGERFEAALETAREVGDRELLADALALRGRYHRYCGDLERAIDDHERGRDVATDIGAPAAACRNCCGLAAASVRAEVVDAALEAARAARDRAADLGDPLLSARAALWLGVALCEDGDSDAGLDHLSAAIDRAEALDATPIACRARYELGAVEEARGNDERAREHLESAASTAEASGLHPLAARCRSALGSL